MLVVEGGWPGAFRCDPCAIYAGARAQGHFNFILSRKVESGDRRTAIVREGVSKDDESFGAGIGSSRERKTLDGGKEEEGTKEDQVNGRGAKRRHHVQATSEDRLSLCAMAVLAEDRSTSSVWSSEAGEADQLRIQYPRTKEERLCPSKHAHLPGCYATVAGTAKGKEQQCRD